MKRKRAIREESEDEGREKKGDLKKI